MFFNDRVCAKYSKINFERLNNIVQLKSCYLEGLNITLICLMNLEIYQVDQTIHMQMYN